jgi:hypothetical protein
VSIYDNATNQSIKQGKQWISFAIVTQSTGTDVVIQSNNLSNDFSVTLIIFHFVDNMF